MTTTTEFVPGCEEFAAFIFEHRLSKSVDNFAFGSVLGEMADGTMTPDEAGDAVFEMSLDNEEMAAVLASLGDPPPEMVGAVFRMSKGLTQKAEALVDVALSLRELSTVKLEAAMAVMREADVIIASADFTDCPSWTPDL